MRNIFLNISDKISPTISKILIVIDEVAKKNNVDFFVAGATARDIILNTVYGIKVHRATNDIDFAIRINSWEQFNSISKDIIRRGFEKTNIIHRFKFNNFPVDFVPFGGITNDKTTITWPDKNEKEMSVLGFSEVYENIELVKINEIPETIVKFASVEGLTILKLVSWTENPSRSQKDADDLLLIMKSYTDAGNLERLMDEHSDLVSETFDYQIAGAKLLGRDVTKIAKKETKDFILKLFNDEIDNRTLSMLAKEMSRYEYSFVEEEDKVQFTTELLNSFKEGLKDF
jgi:predicted nucleotidyltransferase